MATAARRVHRKLSDVELVATETTKRLVADRVLNTSSPRKKALEEDDPRRPLSVPVLVPEAAALVGVNGQRDELARMLLVGEESGDAAAAAERQVVVIVGDAGMGKTTLAHEVYRAVGRHFRRRAWVSASENRSWKSILADILGQVKEPSDGGLDDDEGLIYKSLEHRRYIVIKFLSSNNAELKLNYKQCLLTSTLKSLQQVPDCPGRH
jgi:Cdc6-like AAA superfamily ATPase